jgi:HAD superfamily hydrolase (TIGR01509 family)
MTSTHPVRPAAVIFDMDGLMLDTETIYQRAWQQAANEMGYHIEDSLFLQLVGRRTQDCEVLILAEMGPNFPLETFHERWMEHWDEIYRIDGIELKPGLVQLLDRIDDLAIPKAVATSSTRPEAVRSLSASGLDQRFSIVVTGDQVANGKPAPDIFLEAARRLSIAPDTCWAFEDSSAGAIAADKAGMSVYIVPDVHMPTPEASDAATSVLPSLYEAIPLLIGPAD